MRDNWYAERKFNEHHDKLRIFKTPARIIRDNYSVSRNDGNITSYLVHK